MQSSRQLIRRLSVLDDMMSSMDLLILPSRIHCHDGAIKSLCHSHLDPTYIASGGADAVVRVFNSLSGKCVAQLPGHESIITWVAFSEFDNRSAIISRLRILIYFCRVCLHQNLLGFIRWNGEGMGDSQG